MGRDTLIKRLENIVYQGLRTEYRYDEASVLYSGLSNLIQEIRLETQIESDVENVPN